MRIKSRQKSGSPDNAKSRNTNLVRTMADQQSSEQGEMTRWAWLIC